MAIDSLELKEFKGIKEMEEPIEFSKFNVLIGRNNSGKSTILEALALLPHPYSTYLDKERTSYLLALRGTNSRSFIYGYSGTAKTIYRSSNIHIEIEIYESQIKFLFNGKEITPQDLLSEFKDSLITALITPNNLEDIKRSVIALYDDIVKKGLHTKVIREIINPTIDEEFTEIIRSSDGLRVRKEINDIPIYIKINDLGLGVEKILASLLWLELNEPKIVLWDDFESNIHPTLLKKVLEWLVEKEWQVIISTHSIDVLYRLVGLVERNPKDIRVIRLSKNDDKLLHEYLDTDGLDQLIDANLDPRMSKDKI